jgi:cytochrome P450
MLLFWSYAALLALLIVPANIIYQRFFHPLHRFPGPYWASLTILWYARAVRYGISENYQRPLHEKYGQFVRIAPSMLSVSNPLAIDTIYGLASGAVLQKAAFYDGFNPHLGGRRDAFSERDEQAHTERRRIVAPLYTQGTVLKYEHRFDKVIARFMERMSGYCNSSEVFDMADCLRKYAHDVIGDLYYGYEGGFADADYNNWVQLTETVPDFGAAFSYLPTPFRELFMLSQLVFKGSREGMLGFFRVIRSAKEATNDRVKEMADGQTEGKDDFLSKLLDIAHTKGQDINFTVRDVATEIWNIVWGGSDTTAILLTAVFYLMHKHPATLEKLRLEIDDAFASGRLSSPVKFTDANKLLYLRAVILEATRFHTSLGVGLPRLVPPQGIEICGQWVPGNTTVLMNPPVVSEMLPACF